MGQGAAGHLIIRFCFATNFGSCRHDDLALPEPCGPGLTRQAADRKPCQPPQVLHSSRKVELLGGTLQPTQPQMPDPELTPSMSRRV